MNETKTVTYQGTIQEVGGMIGHSVDLRLEGDHAGHNLGLPVSLEVARWASGRLYQSVTVTITLSDGEAAL